MYPHILSYYLCPYYDRLFRFHIRRNTVVYREKNGCIRSLYTEFACGVRFRSYFSVYDRFSPYTVTKIYDRNTGTSNTAEYGCIRLWKNRRHPFTTLHGNRNLRSGLFYFLPFSIREKLYYVINNCDWNACRGHDQNHDHIHGYFKTFTITITITKKEISSHDHDHARSWSWSWPWSCRSRRTLDVSIAHRSRWHLRKVQVGLSRVNNLFCGHLRSRIDHSN